AGQHTDVVDVLEDYQITNVGLRNHVMIEASESIGSKTIEQKAVAADAVIQNGKRLCCTSRLQALCQEIGPAIVCVGGCAVAISDGVTQNNNRASSGGSGDIDATYEVPVLHFLRIGKIGCRDLVTVCHVRGRTRTRMSGLLCG